MTHDVAIHVHDPDPPVAPRKNPRNAATSEWTDELRKEVVALWKSKSAAEIAEILRGREYTFTREAISGLVRRAGARKGVLVGGNAQIPTGSLASGLMTGIRKRQALAKNGVKAEPFVCKPAPDITPLHLSFEQLESGHCRWVYGGGDDPKTFCGLPQWVRVDDSGATRQSSYCSGHHGICWTPPQKKAAAIPPQALGQHRGGVFGRGK